MKDTMLRHLIFLITVTAVSIFTAPLSAEEVPTLPKIENEAVVKNDSAFRIEDAKSRVTLASVKLSVTDMKAEAGYLVGEYTIRVPLMSSQNDQGKIVLPLECSVDELGEKGGVLRGQAISSKEGTSPNLIVCEIFPGKDQKVLLNITTGSRTIKFKSNYTVVKIAGDS